MLKKTNSVIFFSKQAPELRGLFVALRKYALLLILRILEELEN
jgi:hypothetical protein